MDIIELVKTIRWPAAILLFLIFFCMLFRTQVKNLLERINKFHLKRGQTIEVLVGRDVEEVEKREEVNKVEAIVSEEKTTEVTNERAKLKEPVTAEDWEREMFIAFIIDKDIVKGNEAYKKLQECESNVDNRLENEAKYYHLLFGCGDTSALKKLEDLVQKDGIAPAVKHIAMRYTGFCYEKAGELDKAEVDLPPENRTTLNARLL